MSKIKKICLGLILTFTLSLGFYQIQFGVNAAVGDSGYITPATEETKTTLLGGITVSEQSIITSYDCNNKTNITYTTQHLVMPANSTNTKIVSWSYREADEWRMMGVTEIAENFERNNPGWLVVGGTNADFFDISNTGQMDYNAMENGELVKSRNEIQNEYFRGILGFTKDNELIVGNPTVTDHYNAHIFDSKTDETSEKSLVVNAANPSTISETGITVLTKDATKLYDLTGYKVAVGKYDVVRISDDNAIFVKGEIVEFRDGTTAEKPQVSIQNGEKTERVCEYYLVSKDGSLDELEVGDYVKVQKDYTGKYSEVYNSASYYWKILEDGEALFLGHTDTATKNALIDKYVNAYGVGDFSYITAHKSRCLFGVKEDGSYVMTVVDGTTTTGMTLSEAAVFMKELGCVDAWDFDGGGSATLVARNANGEIETINTPSDSAGAHERRVGNALLMVVRDPGFDFALRYSTPTSITLNKKTNSEVFSKMQNIKVLIDGQEIDVDNNQEQVIISNLLPNTEYLATIKYTYEGVDYETSLPVKTKEYRPGVSFTATSDGFNVKIEKTDEVLQTIKVDIKIDENTYVMDGIDDFTVEGLFLDTLYTIEYTCTVKNTLTDRTYQVDIPAFTMKTLAYQTPKISVFKEYSKRDTSLIIEYNYSDSDSLLTDVYILVNGQKDESVVITKNSGIINFKNLEFEYNTYTYQLVIEYETPDGYLKKIKSEALVYLGNTCEHMWDNDCDNECNQCGFERLTDHQWQNATCENPKTCSVCGETEGSTLEHTWQDATCENPKTCSVCGKTNGVSLGHVWKDATYEEPKTCSVCGKTEGEPLEAKGCAKCKKSSLATILLTTTIFVAGLIIIRKRK